jgi:hypothetical protein
MSEPGFFCRSTWPGLLSAERILMMDAPMATFGRLTPELFENAGVPVSWTPKREPAPSQVDGNDLDHLAARIRTTLQASEAAMRNALRLALDAGDMLIAAKQRIPEGGWGTWLGNGCSLEVRTAQLYMQLARHRDEIEARLEETPDLSLRAARRLIANKQGAQNSQTDAPAEIGKVDEPDWVTAWKQASSGDKTAGFDHFNLKDFFTHMPAAKRAELKELVLGNAEMHAGSKSQRNAIHKLRRKPRPFLELEANPTNN